MLLHRDFKNPEITSSDFLTENFMTERLQVCCLFVHVK